MGLRRDLIGYKVINRAADKISGVVSKNLVGPRVRQRDQASAVNQQDRVGRAVNQDAIRREFVVEGLAACRRDPQALIAIGKRGSPCERRSDTSRTTATTIVSAPTVIGLRADLDGRSEPSLHSADKLRSEPIIACAARTEIRLAASRAEND